MAEVVRKAWGDSLAETAEGVGADIRRLFELISDRTRALSEAGDFYTELTEPQQASLASAMISSGVDISELGGMRTSGDYLRFVDPGTLVAFFRSHPRAWFTGHVWNDRWPDEDLGAVVTERLQSELVTKYLRCLEDCGSYLDYKSPELLLTRRASAAAEFLADKLQ